MGTVDAPSCPSVRVGDNVIGRTAGPRKAPKRSRDRERGAAAVEFALVSMLLITLLFGILQYGWYFFSAQAATSGAREAARRLAVGDCQGPGEAQSFARSQSNLSTMTLTWGSDASPSSQSLSGMDIGDILSVTVQADAAILGLLPMPNGGQIEREVRTRLEDTQDSGAAC